MNSESQNHVGLFHPAATLYRFIILIFVAFLTYGSYFAYDSIGAIAPMLIETLDINRKAIGNLYTAYSIAAIISVFIGGILIDKLGTRKSSLIFSSLVVIGAVIVAISPNVISLFIGRFVFGAGSEALIVAQSSIIARWFKGKELALAFGVGLTISRLGTLFSFNTEALIANYFGHYKYALWAAVLFCLLSLVSNIIYNILDKKGEKALQLREAEAGDKIVLSDIAKFKPSYWYVTLLCVTFYSAIFPFTDLSTDFFHEKWGLPLEAGGSGGFFAQIFSNFIHMFSTAPGTTSIIIFASMCFAPFAGNLVDRMGRRATMMIIGSILMIPSYLFLGLTSNNPILPMIILGVAFVLVPAAMWPSIPLIVEEKRVGTAFGLMTMIQNIGLGLFPLLNGWLRDSTHTYSASMVMFASLGLFGLVFAILLRKADAREGGALESGRKIE